MRKTFLFFGLFVVLLTVSIAINSSTATAERNKTDYYWSERNSIVINLKEVDTVYLSHPDSYKPCQSASSSDTSIATVSLYEGPYNDHKLVIHAIGEKLGQCTISGVDPSGHSFSFRITVEKQFELETNYWEVEFKGWSGGEHKTVDTIKGQAISVVSEDPSIVEASVFEEPYMGLNGIFLSSKGEKFGTTTVTARDDDGDTCVITVVVKHTQHTWNRTIGYKKSDQTYHVHTLKCLYCEETKDEIEEHTWQNYSSYQDFNENYHSKVYKCQYCDAAKIIENEQHNWIEESYWQLNASYHVCESSCWICGRKKTENLPHYWGYGQYYDVLKEATLQTDGIIQYTCEVCGQKVKKTVGWKRGTDYSKSYNPSLSRVYRFSSKIKINHNLPKGSTVKVKIGGKTYKKRITKGKTIRIKLKRKPPYGKKVTVNAYYKNKLIGKRTSRVYYDSKIKRGMTKKQCKNVPGWEYPDDIRYSNNWTFWWYDDDEDGIDLDSYLAFRNGRLTKWYY